MDSRRKFLKNSLLASAGIASLPNLLTAEHIKAFEKRISPNEHTYIHPKPTRLQVSPNGRFLQYADGTPFF